jgi:O-antigen/teichoic acid export membrane protein
MFNKIKSLIPKDYSLSDKFNQDVIWNVGSLVIFGIFGTLTTFLIKGVRGFTAYGVFYQSYTIYVLLSQLAAGGVQLSTLKFISHNQDDRRLCSEIYSSALIITFLCSLPIFFLTLFGKGLVTNILGSPETGEAMILLSPALIFFSLNKVLMNVLNGLRQMKAYAVFQALRYILICVGILIVIILKLPDSHLTLGLTLAEFTLAIILFFYVQMRSVPFIFRYDYKKWFLEHFSFGYRGMMSGVLFNVNLRVDILMLGVIFSDKIVGIYSFASTFIEGMNELTYILRKNVDPVIGKLFASNSIDEINQFAKKIKKMFLPIMLIIGVLTILGFPLLALKGGFTHDFAESWAIYSILMFGIMLISAYRPFFYILIQAGYPGTFTNIMVVTIALNIVGNLFLIPVLQNYGAALATIINYVLQAIFIVVFSKRLLGVRL